MSERLMRSPLLLAALLVASAAIGAALYGLVAPMLGGGDDARVEQLVKDTILENPEILPEAMDNLRNREVGKAVASNQAAITQAFGNAWEGNPEGDVTLVAYMDYACGFCRTSLPIIERLVESDPNLRVVYRELPVLSEKSRIAAQWSLAAAEQGKFMEFHDALYGAGQLSEATIERAIASAGLDRTRASEVAGSPRASEEINRNLGVAGQLGMSGTPSWVIGDRMLSGALPFEALQQAVREARSAN